MAIEKLQKQTYRDNIYTTLREKIISGEILPGQTLTLRDLAEQFGVSIIPIREAIAHLESEGVIIRRSNRDYRVNTLDLSQFEEIYQLREMLECYIAKKACASPSTATADTLQTIYANMERELAEEDLKSYLVSNKDFHFSLYSSGKSPYLAEIIHGLWARVGPYLSIHTQHADYLFSMNIHRKMLDAYIRKNEEALIEALKADIRNSYSALKPRISAQSGI